MYKKKKRGKEIHIKMRTLSAGWSSARHSANVSVVHFKWPCYPSPCLSGPDIKQSLTQQGWILLMEKWIKWFWLAQKFLSLFSRKIHRFDILFVTRVWS